MKLIVIGSGMLLISLLKEIQQRSDIELLGVVNTHFKKKVQDEIEFEIKNLNVPSLALERDILSQADIRLSFNCSKLLPEELVSNVEIINMHVGILPKYRGNSANTWAIMNGETEVGFTIHKMVEQLDAGAIYYVGKVGIDRNQTYSEVYDTLLEKIVKETPEVILEIYNGALLPKEQSGEFLYCTMFSREMGVIKDFNVDSERIYNLYRCMSKPHGTGIFFYKGEKLYEVGQVLLGKQKGVCDYIGIPGKVVNVFGNELWIKTKDNVIIFKDIIDEQGKKIEVQEYFRNGNRIVL